MAWEEKAGEESALHADICNLGSGSLVRYRTAFFNVQALKANT